VVARVRRELASIVPRVRVAARTEEVVAQWRSALALSSETSKDAGRSREPRAAIVFDPPLVPRRVEQRGGRSFEACLASLLDLDLNDLPDELYPRDGCVLERAHEWVAVLGLGLLVRELRPRRLIRAGEAVPGAPTVIIVTTPPRRVAVGQIVDGHLRAVWDPAPGGSFGAAECDHVIAVVSRKHASYRPRCPWCRPA
jgi:hypothetical protein